MAATRPVGLSIGFEEGEEDGDRVVVANVVDGSSGGRRHVGFVKAVDYRDRVGAFMVKRSELDRPYRGRGIGSWAYLSLNDFLKKKYGVPLASDIFRSPKADRLWRRFVSAGVAKGPFPYDGPHGRTARRLDHYRMETAWHAAADALAEGPLEDMDVRLHPRETSGDNLAVNITAAGRPIGHIRIYYERKNGLARVESAMIKNEFHGRGIGSAAYVKLADYLMKKRGLRLASDVTRSEAAERLWLSLVRSGHAHHEPHHAFSKGQYVFD